MTFPDIVTSSMQALGKPIGPETKTTRRLWHKVNSKYPAKKS